MTIDFKTCKLALFMPKVVPKISVISGPEIMYLKGGGLGERKRERERRDEKGREVQAIEKGGFLHL